MNKVSPCCHSVIVQGTVREYPLGGRTWYQTFSVDICQECGKEVEEILLEDEETGEIVGSVT